MKNKINKVVSVQGTKATPKKKEVTFISDKVTPIKKVKAPKVVSKQYLKAKARIQSFDKNNASQWERLLTTSAQCKIANMGLNNAIKYYLGNAQAFLTPQMKKALTFKEVITFLHTTEYANLELFTPHQITLICNRLLKAKFKAIRQLERAEKQNKATAKK